MFAYFIIFFTMLILGVTNALLLSSGKSGLTSVKVTAKIKVIKIHDEQLVFYLNLKIICVLLYLVA